MKRILSLIALILALTMLPVALFACNEAATEAPTEAPTQAPTEAPTEKPKSTEAPREGTEYKFLDILDNIKINGRYVTTKTGLACDNLGSGFEFNGVMKGKVYLTVQKVFVAGNSRGVYYTVYIDGVRQEKRFFEGVGLKGGTMTIADFGETEGQHHIRVVKQTEARYARAEFVSLTMDGTFAQKPAEKELMMEFVGSDLICGMGNFNGKPEHEPGVAQTAEYEDGTQSVSFLVAEALNADVSIMGVSGMGVDGSWFEPVTAPFYYDYTSYYRNNQEKYDHAAGRKADVIVLNIGKNDNNIPVDRRPTDEEFKKAAKDYLTFLMETHGEDVKIVWTYDITQANPDKNLEYNDCRNRLAAEVIEELGGEEKGLYIYQIYTNRLGGQEHTDMAGHKTAAEGLLAFLKENNIAG